jgi:DNA invertase Pin-like site-specific DNA recombinase
MKDAICYIRVSSEEQADSGLGLEAQRRCIDGYCQMKGLRVDAPGRFVLIWKVRLPPTLLAT